MFSTKSTNVNKQYEASSDYCTNCGAFIGPESFFCQSCGAKVTVVTDSSRLQTFKGYIQVLAIVEIVFGIMALFAGLFVTFFVPFLFYVLRDEISAEVGEYTSVNVIALVSVLVFGIGLLLFVYAFASIISGRKLLQHKNSGRIGTMVIGALSLFNFPFGTFFGLAALYVLSQPEVEQLYTK